MSTKEQYEEPEENGKKWSYWGIGLLFFLVFFVALMFILEAAMQPRESFISTLIAYILGIVGIAIFAGLVRDKSRVLISVPLLLIIVFGAGYLFTYVIQAPVYNPFAPVSERAVLILDTMDEMNDTLADIGITDEGLNMDDVRFFSQFAFVIDLIIALPLFIFGTLSLTWMVQIFTTRPRILTILSAFFALVFFFIGLILTPFIHLLFAGVVIIGGDLLPGVLYLGQGFSIFANFENATQEEMDEAILAFYLASEYFQQSAENLQGLEQAGIIGIAGAMGVLGTFIENIYFMSLAALHIASGLGPFANGTFYVLEGMEDATASFGSGGGFLEAQDGSTTQVQSVINDTLFDEGIAKVNEGLLILGNSTEYIDDALEELAKVDLEALIEETGTLPGVPEDFVADMMTQVEQISTYLSIFEDAVTLIDVLLTKPDGSEYATLTHFLYGAYNLFKAGDEIGTSTNFINETSGVDTSLYFDIAADHFDVVYNELLGPDVQGIAESDTPILNSTISFLTDMVGLTVPVCRLGGDLADVFFTMQTELTVFESQDFENITNYPELISGMDNLRNATGELVIDATDVDTQIWEIRQAANDSYGEMSEVALSFTDQMVEFNFTQNAYNADNLANSFYFMYDGLMHLRYGSANVTAGYEDFNNTNYVPDAENHFISANDSLNTAIVDFTEASYYINQTENGGMTQLAGARDAMLSIRNNLYGVVASIEALISIMTLPDPSLEILTVQDTIANITTSFANVNSDLDNVNAQ